MNIYVVDILNKVAQELARDHNLTSTRRFPIIEANSATEAINKAREALRNA